MLDVTHTAGVLKRRVLTDLGRFVSAAGHVRGLLEVLADAGKRLFVVTNSHRDYALAVLEAVAGGAWARTFDLVAVDSRKPAFFDPRTPAIAVSVSSGSPVIEHANAATIEAFLGTRGGRILFAGDNLRADTGAARGFGWRTAHVAAELGAPADASPWGPVLSHEGDLTWFAQSMIDHSDLLCDRVDRLLDLPRRGVVEPPADWRSALRQVDAP